MTFEQKQQLCDFFLHSFGKLQQMEENKMRAICADNLSIKELYVLEAVLKLTESGENTMANTAKALAVSPGSLTTAVNVLVKKGYIERRYTVSDRRVIYISVTDIGQKAAETYIKYTKSLVDNLASPFSENELDSIISFLKNLPEEIER